jgi:alcohol dehydrogenase class IV
MFEFATAGRIVFGEGTATQAAEAAARLGKRVLLVSGSVPRHASRLASELEAVGLVVVSATVDGEPAVNDVLALVAEARTAAVDVVVSIGGGSTIDSGKAAAALVANPGDPFDYLEVVGRGQALRRPPLPHLALPTTAGTGSEVTRNAVLGVPEARVKVSLRSPMMLPTLAIVDPELTYSVPPAITAATGMDALTQLIEPFVSVRANPLTDAICRAGIPLAARALPRAVADGADAAARRDMAMASLLGGLALANAGLGAVHGFAGPIGGMFAAPHGMVCARLLPFVMEANIRALRARQPDAPALDRYREIAANLTGRPEASAEDGVDWARSLSERLGVRPLRDYGMQEGDAAEVVARTLQASSTRGNPIVMSEGELTALYSSAL